MGRCPEQPSTEFSHSSWVYITLALKCLFLMTAEDDVALGQTLPLPKHESVWPSSKAFSSLRAC